MRYFSWFLLLIICPATQNSHSFAQTGRGTASEVTGSTTEGLRGLTTEGPDAGNTGMDNAGRAGDNAAQEFIGSPNVEGFVGGARQSMTPSTINRFFRAVTGEEVTTGSTQESSGTPRRIPVTLRLGFEVPPPRAVTLPAGSGTYLQRFLWVRPGLSGVNFLLDNEGIAKLTGYVSEESNRRLAANLIRLQPGVTRIRNNIEIRADEETSN